MVSPGNTTCAVCRAATRRRQTLAAGLAAVVTLPCIPAAAAQEMVSREGALLVLQLQVIEQWSER